MQVTAATNLIRPVFKYIYLTAFFGLLAGFFHPIITQTSFDSEVLGIFTLFLGLGGAVLVWKSTGAEVKYPIVMLIMGAILLFIAMYLIYVIALGRF
jgi:hypothetical protein